MHRSYQPILPSHNKLLQKRWDNTYYDVHRSRVKSAKPIVDTKPPQTYIHMHLKLKKLQLEEERMSTIERDNRLLLEKMSQIIRTKGRVDNRNYYKYKSLNYEKRQRELLRVTRENQQILSRITVKEPEYSHIRLEREWRKQEELMDNIARYPKNWWKQVEKQRKKKMKSGQQSQVSTHTNKSITKSETPLSRGQRSSTSSSDDDETPRVSSLANRSRENSVSDEDQIKEKKDSSTESKVEDKENENV